MRRSISSQTWILAGILALAALLRFAHLDAGLRHTPHIDERYFIESVARMQEHGNLDPGWYEYPGLMFLLLAAEFRLLGIEPTFPAAYLAGRALTAACGVVALLLAWRFGRRLASPTAALFAVALLAVSRVQIQMAHTMGTDVVLECLALLVFLAILGLDGSWRRDALLGAALGLAVGLKYSGGLLVVPVVLARVLVPRTRVRGLLLVAATALLAFGATSSYLLQSSSAGLSGLVSQVGFHYQREGSMPYSLKLLNYARVWPETLGWPALTLALGGLVLVRRQWRRWLPFVSLPVVTAAVFASTDYFFMRHLIPSMSVVALLAGVGFAWLLARARVVSVGIAVVSVAVPFTAAWRYIDSIGHPSTLDRAADLVAERLPGVARVLVAVPLMRVDAERFEVLRFETIASGSERLFREVSAIVSRNRDEPRLAALPPGEPVEPYGTYGGPPLFVRILPAPPAPTILPIAGASLTTSAAVADAGSLRDGRLDTFWSVEAEAGRPEWIELVFPAPLKTDRVELMLGDRPEDAGRGLTLQVSADGHSFGDWASWPARPPTREQLPELAPYSEVLVFEPVEIRGLRVVRTAGTRRWSVAEIQVQRSLP